MKSYLLDLTLNEMYISFLSNSNLPQYDPGNSIMNYALIAGTQMVTMT